MTRPRWVASLAAMAVAAAMCVLGTAGPANAVERPDSLGKDFWVAFSANLGSPQLSLFISSPTATSGNVSVPGLGFSEDFTVTPGAVTTVTIPVGAQLGDGSSGNPENRAMARRDPDLDPLHDDDAFHSAIDPSSHNRS